MGEVDYSKRQDRDEMWWANGKHVMFGTKLNFKNNNDNVKLVHIPLTDGGGVYAELRVFTLKNGKPEPATGRFLSLCTDALEKFL